MNWQTILELIAVLGSMLTAIGALIGFVLKKYIESRFKADADATQRAHDARMEELRTEQSLHLNRQVGLNAKRAAAIEAMYFGLMDYGALLHNSADAYDEQLDELALKRLEQSLKDGRKAWLNLISRNSLYVEKEVEDKIDELDASLKMLEKQQLQAIRSPDAAEFDKIIELLDGKIIPTTEALKASFQKLLGF